MAQVGVLSNQNFNFNNFLLVDISKQLFNPEKTAKSDKTLDKLQIERDNLISKIFNNLSSHQVLAELVVVAVRP